MKKFCALFLGTFPACYLHAQSTPAPAAAAAQAPAMPTRERMAKCLEREAGLGAAPAIEQVESFSLAKEFPFIGEAAGDAQGWRVRLVAKKLPWPEKLPGNPDAHARRCTVFLDAGAERILAVTARAEDIVPAPAPTAAPAKADRTLLTRMTGWLGPFSRLSPKVSCMEALVRACHGGAGYPPMAYDIDAYHLQYQASGEPERSVWLVDLHGLPAFPVIGPVLSHPIPTPKPGSKHFGRGCVMVDAATGELLYPMAEDTPDPRFPNRE